MDRFRSALVYCCGLGYVFLASGCAVSPIPAPAPAPAPVVETAPPAPLPSAPPPPPPTTSTSQTEQSAGPVLYKLWYATNRVAVTTKGEIVDYASTWDRGNTHYGKIYAEIPKDYLKQSYGKGFFARLFPTNEAKLRLTKPNELSSPAFIDDLKTALERSDSDERQLLIYLHGFNTTFKEAAQRAASIGYQLKMPATAFFSWPSQGGLLKYVADRDFAHLSEDSIADFIIKTCSESGAKRVHLIAHSMGNHALLGAMYRPRMQQAIKDGLRFGQVILAAPDVETEMFRKDVHVFQQVAERVSVYVSDGDQALRASRLLAAGVPRAGYRPPIVIVDKIDTIDVSSTNLSLLGHAFVSQEIAVLNDMYSLILHNDPPSNRINLVQKGDYWELQ